MSSMTLSNDDLAQSDGPAWSAVFAMALCVFVLIASEFMPVSLLSPIARDLDRVDGLPPQLVADRARIGVACARHTEGRLDRRR